MVLGSLNETRGQHAHGFAHVDPKGTWQRRRGKNGIMLAFSHFSRYNRLMAHTRFSTNVNYGKATAHPFRREGLLLAHNGMIHNYLEIIAETEERCTVDSELIANRLAADKDLSDLEGYGTITWVEGTDPWINLCRISDDGELAVAKIVQGDGNRAVVYSSDHQHLAAALDYAELKHRYYAIDDYTVYEAHANGLYRTEREYKVETFSTAKWYDKLYNDGEGSAWSDYSVTSSGIETGDFVHVTGGEHYGAEAWVCDILLSRAVLYDEKSKDYFDVNLALLERIDVDDCWKRSVV